MFDKLVAMDSRVVKVLIWITGGLLLLLVGGFFLAFHFFGLKSYLELKENYKMVKQISAFPDDVSLDSPVLIPDGELVQTYNGVWSDNGGWVWGGRGPIHFNLDESISYEKVVFCGEASKIIGVDTFAELVAGLSEGSQLLVEYKKGGLFGKEVLKVVSFGNDQLFGPFSKRVHAWCDNQRFVER